MVVKTGLGEVSILQVGQRTEEGEARGIREESHIVLCSAGLAVRESLSKLVFG